MQFFIFAQAELDSNGPHLGGKENRDAHVQKDLEVPCMKQKEPMIHQLKTLLTLPFNDAMPSPLINAVRVSLGCLIFLHCLTKEMSHWTGRGHHRWCSPSAMVTA